MTRGGLATTTWDATRLLTADDADRNSFVERAKLVALLTRYTVPGGTLIDPRQMTGLDEAAIETHHPW